MKVSHVTASCVLMMVLLCSPLSFAGNMDPDGASAWGENIGWIHFAPPGQAGVTVCDAGVSGIAWGENIGWVNFGVGDSSPGSGVQNDGNGNLSGFAWGENIGWLNLDGVRIDPKTGIFTGCAWGENIGWVCFDFPGSPKKVVTLWRKTIPGDVTGEGAVTFLDAVTVLQLMSKKNAPAFSLSTRADVNEDNKIDITEMIYILQKISQSR